MKTVFVAGNPTEAHAVRTMLEEAGIRAAVNAESLFALRGLIGCTPDTQPSVSIYDESQLEQALGIVSAYEIGRNDAETAGGSWQCPKCGETIEAQFNVCWQCNTARADAE